MSNIKTSNLMACINKLKYSNIGKEILPLECSFGWPIPVEYNGRLAIKVFYYRATKEQNKSLTVNAPFVEFTIDYKTKNIVGFSLIKYDNKYAELKQSGEIGIFPHEAIATMNVQAYKEKQDEALSIMEDIFESKAHGTSLNKEKVIRLKELMNLLISPCLMPYYKKLNETFVSRLLDVE